MDCYYYPSKAAVGICKHCSKGVCHECANDEGYGIACKNKHEAEVRSVYHLIQINLKTMKDAPQNMWLAPIFYLVMGTIFIVNGMLNPHSSTYYFLLAFGGAFMAFGALNVWRAYRIFGSKNK